MKKFVATIVFLVLTVSVYAYPYDIVGLWDTDFSEPVTFMFGNDGSFQARRENQTHLAEWEPLEEVIEVHEKMILGEEGEETFTELKYKVVKVLTIDGKKFRVVFEEPEVFVIYPIDHDASAVRLTWHGKGER